MHPLEKFHFCPICGTYKFYFNNEISKRCEECGFIYYSNPRAATVAVIKNKNNEILVAVRANEPAKGTLDLPGGFIDLNETAEQGVAREVLEETGLKVNCVKYLFSIPNVYPYSGIVVDTMDLFFECLVEDDSIIKAMDDVCALKWIKINDLNPDDFGLRSIKEGILKLFDCYIL